ncbi:uncharacterized protein LOC143305224 [Osmia lignaria lignaria]|uniref:uncharacterized protein LOC143305224 n=1 Tax=Osmia lignaria lignaria TaxID=1437193 RepID=UPI00402B1125
MAFFQLLLKARKLEKARVKYEDEKFLSIEISKGAKPKYTLKQKFRRKKLFLKKKVKKFFDKILSVPKNSWSYKKIIAIRTDGTLENFVAKSLFGFISGILLTYMFFVFFVFQLNFKLSSATTICTIIGVILTIGLAFSYRIRCVVLLLLPQFFSKRGRQALMAYAFILALTGPVKNTLHNTSVLTESLACAQEQLKEAVKTVIDLAKQPFYALRDAISKVIKSVKVVVKKIKQTLVAIKRLVLSILKVITSVFQWLGSVINICNKKLGTPFDRCQRVFEGAVADCKAKLGPYFGVVCNITYIVSTLCYIVKPLDFICMLVSYVADTVVGAVRTKIKKFTMHMKAMFYVKVKFSHSFHFETNQSKTVGEVSTSIATEVRSRTDALFGFFDWMSFVTSFFTFFILLRVMRYRYKWLTSERFDNRYITDDLRTIDLIRARQDKETVLPLNPRERNKYVPLSSVMLIKPERLKLGRSAVFLCLATVKLGSYMIIDYSLYWVLKTIQLYGRFQSKVERPSVVTIHVSGDGYLSDLYRSIVKAFTPQGQGSEIDTMLCLPAPVTPDLDKYTQIITLIIFCWLMAFLEPYGLRLRQVVMCQYYPDRAKQRAAWLYNHIIRSRGSFLKFARRQLRRKFGLAEGEKIERVTLKERLWATLPCLRVLFPMKQRMCLLCGAVEQDDNLHIKCPTPGCVGLYCSQCFADLQNMCTICQSPVEYGDLSDMSEEFDSSDDQLPVIKVEPAKPEEEEEEPLLEEEETVIEEEEEEQTEEPTEEPTEEQTVEPEEERTEVEVEEEEKVKKEDLSKGEEKVEKEVAQQTDDKYVEYVDRSSESSYSYTYQDESPQEAEIEKCREPFKDLEAQKIRDDVTIQIFNEPFIKDTCSSCDSPSGFVVRARRKVCARLKKRRPREKDSDSSTSIADTESWSTEEVDEEEVIHIEVDDSSEELLPKDRKDKEKRGRINKIVSAVARIPWLGKAENDKKCRGLQRKRPSLMNRIVSMLHKKQSMPVQSYRRSRKTKDSWSSSTSCDDEQETLLSSRDDRHLTRRRIKRTTDESDEVKNLNLRHPCEKRFTTKRLPRYLESTARSTSYFEVDETEDSRTARKCVRRVDDINKLSSKGSTDVKKRDYWNITEDDELIGPCSCTSEITYDTTGDREILEMTTISEHTDDTKKHIKETETEGTMTVSESEMDYTDETDEVEISRKADDTKGTIKYPDESDDTKDTIKYPDESDDTKDTIKYPDESDDFSEYKKSVDLKDKKEEGKGLSKKPEKKVKTKVAKTKIISAPPKEDTEKVAEIPASTYDPLAGLELYGVSYKPKERPAPRKQKADIEREVEETEETEETKATRTKQKSNIISAPPEEDTENIIEIPRHRGGGSVYDPLAGLELYGVNYKSKGRSAPVRQKIDAEKKAEEAVEIEKTEEAEEIEKIEEPEEIEKTEEVEETEKTTEKELEKDVK